MVIRNDQSFKIFLMLIAFALIFVGLPTLSAMAADDVTDGDIKNTGLSLGLRATYYNPNDGDESWFGGAQFRAHLGPVFAVEGSIDYRRTDFGSTEVHTYPVLVSALLYLFPGRFAPFLLGGVGWYFTHTDTPAAGDSDDSRFGAHAGGGLEFYLNRYWSIDGTYRYVWVEKVDSKNAPPLQKHFDDNGHMITAALNYHF